MTDDRILDIFQAHGQYATGKDYAMIHAIAEAVSSQRTWVGLTDEEIKEIKKSTIYMEDTIRLTEFKLKEKNT